MRRRCSGPCPNTSGRVDLAGEKVPLRIDECGLRLCRGEKQTCEKSLQLLALVGNDVVCGGDEGAARAVDAELQAQIVL